MRTTVDIPGTLMDDVKRLLKVRTKREAITMALKEVRARKCAEEIKRLAGKIHFDTDAETIRGMSERRHGTR